MSIFFYTTAGTVIMYVESDCRYIIFLTIISSDFYVTSVLQKITLIGVDQGFIKLIRKNQNLYVLKRIKEKMRQEITDSVDQAKLFDKIRY